MYVCVRPWWCIKKKPARAHVSNVCVRIYFATSARVCGIQQNRPRRHGNKYRMKSFYLSPPSVCRLLYYNNIYCTIYYYEQFTQIK